MCLLDFNDAPPPPPPASFPPSATGAAPALPCTVRSSSDGLRWYLSSAAVDAGSGFFRLGLLSPLLPLAAGPAAAAAAAVGRAFAGGGAGASSSSSSSSPLPASPSSSSLASILLPSSSTSIPSSSSCSSCCSSSSSSSDADSTGASSSSSSSSLLRFRSTAPAPFTTSFRSSSVRARFRPAKVAGCACWAHLGPLPPAWAKGSGGRCFTIPVPATAPAHRCCSRRSGRRAPDPPPPPCCFRPAAAAAVGMGPTTSLARAPPFHPPPPPPPPLRCWWPRCCLKRRRGGLWCLAARTGPATGVCTRFSSIVAAAAWKRILLLLRACVWAVRCVTCVSMDGIVCPRRSDDERCCP